METKEIIIDLQNIIQTMRKINFKKSIVTTYFISITSSNENKNDQNNEEQQQVNKINNKAIIEMQNKLIEFIISKKNSNFNNKTRNQKTKLVSLIFNKIKK